MSDPDDLYDLAPAEERPATTSPPPVARAPLQYQTPRVAAETPDQPFPDKVIDLYLPLALVAGGVGIEVVAALIRGARSPLGFEPQLARIAVKLLLGTATMLVGVLIAVRFRGIELGRFWTAVLKLAGVAIAPGAVVTVLSPALGFIPLGFLIGFIVQFVLYFALLGTLFKLDESDTWYVVCVIFLIDLGVYFTLLAMRG
jgi:hypothetical protein